MSIPDVNQSEENKAGRPWRKSCLNKGDETCSEIAQFIGRPKRGRELQDLGEEGV